MRKKAKKAASLPSPKARTARARLRSKGQSTAPSNEPRRSVEEIIDEYRDRHAKIVR
jgi:hypothetical protein